uniref:Uncharacterized protein orf105 n=1 Tax=Pedinomonas minor TaxID=3159 RepID=C7BER9_PEDMN|nr:hypothetical protein PrmiC_p069 [Pedinomonas minor]ACQ90906.1 hypothetical protein [Pedinomonas minor]
MKLSMITLSLFHMNKPVNNFFKNLDLYGPLVEEYFKDSFLKHENPQFQKAELANDIWISESSLSFSERAKLYASPNVRICYRSQMSPSKRQEFFSSLPDQPKKNL